MPIRDIIITSIIFGGLPFVFKDPLWGVVLWNWIAFANPHQYVWGFAHGFRFALVVAVATVISIALKLDHYKFRLGRIQILMLAFLGWVALSTYDAIFPDLAVVELLRFSKIILMVLVAIVVVDSRERLNVLVWTVVISLGFFGVKGGIFTLLTGGKYIVWGPPNSFIAGNNELAFALIMVFPLFKYLQSTSKKKWVKYGLGVSMVLVAFSVVGSNSRGAFLAVIAMAFFLVLKSRQKALLAIVVVVCGVLLFTFMPQKWHQRMSTIKTYQEDASAMGRINAWWFAWNLALDNPLTGGGSGIFTQRLFYRYAPDPENVKDAHSIYFEVLGERGFVGLALFIILFFVSVRDAGLVQKYTRGDPEFLWAYDLCAMCQVSLVGYGVGGAFLGLAYFDLPYTLIAMIEITKLLVLEQKNSDSSGMSIATA